MTAGLPLAAVVTFAAPMKYCPSPSLLAFAKNSTRKVVLGVLFSVQEIVVPVPSTAEFSTGQFCRLFGPVSPSPASFALTPSFQKSMPSPLLAVIELPLIRLAVLAL